MTKSAKILGILGGGQLGRMSAVAAARLGIKTHIYTPESGSPASHVAAQTFTGDWDDRDALADFAGSVDVISYEFENVPVETVRYLQTLKPVYPDPRILEIAQSRTAEKTFFNKCGIPTPAWAVVSTAEELEKAAQNLGKESYILKTDRFGYDGKGQCSYTLQSDPQDAFNDLKSKLNILEEKIDFQCEISILVVRSIEDQMLFYDPILNRHEAGILVHSTVPSGLSPDIEKEALNMAGILAEKLDLVGILALEMFVTRDGRLLANEMAPRPHNSGHWTIDACAVSQFESHVRSVCGLPLGSTQRHSDAVMHNLIEDDVNKAAEWLTKENTCVHLYGKAETRPGRKMGHVTVLS